nr:hypothetical protein [Variovorax sp. TBS-050B]
MSKLFETRPSDGTLPSGLSEPCGVVFARCAWLDRPKAGNSDARVPAYTARASRALAA